MEAVKSGMNAKRSFFIAPLLLLALLGTAFGQKKNQVFQNRYLSRVKTDGNLSEWGDSLQAYNPATHLAYAVANDDQNLYVAIKTSDPVEIRKISNFGFSFSVNTGRRKRPESSLTFPLLKKQGMEPTAGPLPSRGRAPENSGKGGKADPDKRTRAIITHAAGFEVQGFAQIPDGAVSIDNEYGIRAGAAIDSAGVLKCELAIPLNMIALSSGLKSPVYYNFKVNGLTRTVLQRGMSRPGYGYGYGYGYSYPYGDNGTYKRTISDSKDFWVRYTLANP